MIVSDDADQMAEQVEFELSVLRGESGANHPTSMFIDFEVLIADEEIGYTADQVVRTGAFGRTALARCVGDRFDARPAARSE